MIRLRSARWRGRLTARLLWNDPLSTLMRSSTPVAPERRAPSAISPRVGRRDDECLASNTSAARVASLENVTHLPQKDRTAFPADAVSDCGTRRVPVGAVGHPSADGPSSGEGGRDCGSLEAVQGDTCESRVRAECSVASEQRGGSGARGSVSVCIRIIAGHTWRGDEGDVLGLAADTGHGCSQPAPRFSEYRFRMTRVDESRSDGRRTSR